MNMTYLENRMAEMLKSRPDLREEILNLYEMAQENVAEGRSEAQEVQMCLASLEEMAEENRETQNS